MKKIFYLLYIISFISYGQDDLFNEIDSLNNNEIITSSFKSLKIINLESTKLASKGDFYFIVSHRFDYFKNGFDDFFGLDNANTRLQFLYGISKDISVHVSRSGFQKTYEGAIKYKLINQKKVGSPFDVVGFNSIAVNSSLSKEVLSKLAFNDRLSYVSQILVSRKFNDFLSLELAPTYLHENYVSYNSQQNDQFLFGVGGRYKFSKRWSLNFDYAAHLNRSKGSPNHNPLSIGFDLETGGHIFQMHFTNAQAMHESGYLANTVGDWLNGQIAFGFNLVRVF